MNSFRCFAALTCAIGLLVGPVQAVDKAPGKPTCCQEAAAKGKDCRHKCCVAAHREGKSCSKCNPNKEDLKLKKETQKGSNAVTK